MHEQSYNFIDFLQLGKVQPIAGDVYSDMFIDWLIYILVKGRLVSNLIERTSDYGRYLVLLCEWKR